MQKRRERVEILLSVPWSARLSLTVDLGNLGDAALISFLMVDRVQNTN